jgi:hypothetical protein
VKRGRLRRFAMRGLAAMKCVRVSVAPTLSSERGSSNDVAAGVVLTMLRAQAAWRASVVSSVNRAAVSRRSCMRGVTPLSRATVRSSIATAVRVKLLSLSVTPWKSKNGRLPAFLPRIFLRIRTCARSWAPRTSAQRCLAAAILRMVPTSSACV